VTGRLALRLDAARWRWREHRAVAALAVLLVPAAIVLAWQEHRDEL
jgi:hypothetical protein